MSAWCVDWGIDRDLRINENRSITCKSIFLCLSLSAAISLRFVETEFFLLCGITLQAGTGTKWGGPILICVETVDDEHFVTMVMNGQEHYVSFVAYVTAGSLEIAKCVPGTGCFCTFSEKGAWTVFMPIAISMGCSGYGYRFWNLLPGHRNSPNIVHPV